MKKLIMVLALVAAVVSAKAACVDWAVKGTASDVGTTVYLLTAMSDFDSVDALQAAAISSSAIASAGRGAYASPKQTANDSSVTATASFYYAIVNGDTYTYVAADGLQAKVYDPNNQESSKGVFNTMSVSDIAAGTSKTFGGGGGDVPEPTSGLLLLVGGAMLALRRRRA